MIVKRSGPLDHQEHGPLIWAPSQSFTYHDLDRKETYPSKLWYAKSRFNHSHQIKVWSRPLIQLHFGVSWLATWRGNKYNHQNRDMRNRDLIASVRSRCDLDRWSNSISKFHESWLGEARNISTRKPKSRYVKSWHDLSHWIKIRDGPSNHRSSC